MTSAQVHERNALTVKGRKINWFDIIIIMTVGKGQKFKKRKWKPVLDVKSSKIKSKKKRDWEMTIKWK